MCGLKSESTLVYIPFDESAIYVIHKSVLPIRTLLVRSDGRYNCFPSLFKSGILVVLFLQCREFSKLFLLFLLER